MTRTAIFSHVTREHTRRQTIDALAVVGVTPSVITIQTEPGAQWRNRHNALDALSQAADGTAVLLLEDDVIAASTLPLWLSYLERVNITTDLCVTATNHYPNPLGDQVAQQKYPPESQVLPMPDLRKWWGSQAVWIPAHVIDGILAESSMREPTHSPWGPWDHTLRKYHRDNNLPFNVAYPSVFDHLNPRSVVNRSNQRRIKPARFTPDAKPPAERN